MTLIVESGAGNIASESYVSVAGCSAYCALQGLTFDISLVSTAESALRRATQFIDYTYRNRFPGTRTKRRLQALEWPRTLAYYYSPDEVSNLAYFTAYAWPYDIIDPATIPIEIVNATCQAAVFENATPNVLLTGSAFSSSPASVQSASSGQITKVKAGDSEIDFDFSHTAMGLQIISDVVAGKIMIDVTLAPLIMVAKYTARAARR